MITDHRDSYVPALLPRVVTSLLLLPLLISASSAPAHAQDTAFQQAQDTFRMAVAAQTGEPPEFEEARALYLSAATQVTELVARRPVDNDVLLAYDIQMNCYAEVGMAAERRAALDELLAALPGSVPADATAAALTRIAEGYVGDLAYRIPRLITTPEHIIRLQYQPQAADLVRATDALSRFAELYPDAPQAPGCLLRCLDIWLDYGRDLDLAMEFHGRLVGRYDASAEAIRADYLMGVASFHLGSRAWALEALSRVVARSPESVDGQVAASYVRAAAEGSPRRTPLSSAYEYNTDGRSAMPFLLYELVVTGRLEDCPAILPAQ